MPRQILASAKAAGPVAFRLVGASREALNPLLLQHRRRLATRINFSFGSPPKSCAQATCARGGPVARIAAMDHGRSGSWSWQITPLCKVVGKQCVEQGHCGRQHMACASFGISRPLPRGHLKPRPEAARNPIPVQCNRALAEQTGSCSGFRQSVRNRSCRRDRTHIICTSIRSSRVDVASAAALMLLPHAASTIDTRY